ncbi:hypothetical protein [Bacillus thuringiensis]|uniref:hypothetical protein n=1 Tax=Bacillus thuringiensis TaxID=1428 RepID=UPI0015CF2880|nr:hypothetical protein [Bacillus thuringiensis]
MSDKSGYGTYPDLSLASGDQPEPLKKFFICSIFATDEKYQFLFHVSPKGDT